MDSLHKQLEIYKENYARYRVTGDINAKTVADTALGEASKIIKEEQAQYEQGNGYIQNFVSSFKERNPDLVEMHQKASSLQRQVPLVQNEYVQTQMMNESPIAAHIDYTPYLIKLAVVVGLGVAAGLAATL
jgi:hypothetical protein